MAAHIEVNLEFIAEISIEKKKFLNQLRHWYNLKIASNDHSIWIKGFDTNQFHDVAVQSIPSIKLYSIKGKDLTPWGKVIPSKVLPNLLWTPIQLGIPVNLPKLNSNYFGFEINYIPKLVPVEFEIESTVLVSTIDEADEFIQTTSAHRLNPISWTILENKQVLFLGEPMLPIKGKSYWLKNNFIIPAGFNLEFSFLESEISTIIDASNSQYIWWVTEFEFVLIDKSDFTPLSISSWRNSIYKTSHR